MPDSDLPPIVREIADDWLTRAVARSHEPLRAPHRQACSSCRTSPLLASLGPFGAWPHMFIHPLLTRIHDVVAERAAAALEDERAELRERYLYRVDAYDDLTLPDDDAIMWAARVYRHELGETREREADAVATGMREAAQVLDVFCSTHALTARDVIVRLVDSTVATIADLEPGTVMDRVEVGALAAALDTAVSDWTVWLPTMQWQREPVVPQGEVCRSCAAVALADRIEGPHGATHRLVVALGRVLLDHIERFGSPRIEPPASGDTEGYGRDVVRAYSRWFGTAHPVIDRMLRLYVLDDVDEDVNVASRHLLVAPEDAPD